VKEYKRSRLKLTLFSTNPLIAQSAEDHAS
jgi:hypothetical protein